MFEELKKFLFSGFFTAFLPMIRGEEVENIKCFKKSLKKGGLPFEKEQFRYYLTSCVYIPERFRLRRKTESTF